MNRSTGRRRAAALEGSERRLDAMSTTVADLLGVGLYSVRDAALYARIPPRRMVRWMFGDSRSEAVIDRQLKSEEKFVTFLDFVQAMAVRAVRLERKIPLPKIRKAIQKAEKAYGVRYPFARKHKTFLVGSEIVIKLGDEEFVEVSGRHAGNLVIPAVAELYMIDLGFDAHGLAAKYTPDRLNGFEVVMDPKARFGEPLLPSCGYTAKALWQAFKAEGSLEMAAKVYGVQRDEVVLACRYYDNLLSLAV
jgi:hypothetical protein